MSHGITKSDTMFSVKEKPWHKLGTVLNDAPSIEDAIKHAGLCWEVGLKQLYAPSNDETLQADQPFESVDAQATYRKDTNNVLGVVGPNYKPLQNDKAFNFFQPFIDSGIAILETAVSMFEGRKVFVLAKINMPDAVIVPDSDDRIKSYVLLSNSHDGKNAVKVGFTPVRVVCNNTLTMAHRDNASKLIRVKHSGKTIQNLENIRETMNLITQDFEATAVQFRLLADTDINQKDVKKYFTDVFNLKDEAEMQRRGRTLEQLIELFETGRGNHLPGVKGTAWAAYNAATEYMQYYSGKDTQSRIGSLWFGANESKNRAALEKALALV